MQGEHGTDHGVTGATWGCACVGWWSRVVGGHGRGGTWASEFLRRLHAPRAGEVSRLVLAQRQCFKGLVLHGASPAGAMPNEGLHITSVYGTKDGFLAGEGKLQKWEDACDALVNLRDTEFIRLRGANHSQLFSSTCKRAGWLQGYFCQDRKAEVTREHQMDKAVTATVKLLETI